MKAYLLLVVFILFASSLFAETYTSQDAPVSFRLLKRDPSPLPKDYKPILRRHSPKTRAAINYFEITYLGAGDTDRYGETCSEFPQEAQNAFERAAEIWSGFITTSVPITIEACWADLSAYGSILGYSSSPMKSGFLNAPMANTYYNRSLANAFAGEDLDPEGYDSYITYNNNVDFYYGLDGNTPWNESDLLTVVLHEMGHSLNFSGLADYNSGTGDLSYVSIFDRFTEDSSATPLVDYPSPSTSLGDALISNSVWFNGTHANAANGGSRVKLYAPSTWSSGSSYSHLDYNTYNNTENGLMVYRLTDGEAIHDPGDVTLGILEDMGWEIRSTPSTQHHLNPSIIMYLLH